jgi:hypothetical protein
VLAAGRGSTCRHAFLGRAESTASGSSGRRTALVSAAVSHEDEELDEIPVDGLLVDIRSFEVQLPDGGRWQIDDDLAQGLISEESVRDFPLATVAEALGILSDHVQEGAPEGWFLETDPPGRLYEIELHEGLALQSWGSDQLFVTVSIGLPVDFDEEFERSIDDLVSPLLKHAGAVCRVSLIFEHMVTVMVRFESMRDRSVGDLIDLGDHVRALLLAVRSGQPDEAVALNLVLAGHALTLVGQPESRWLDAKRQLWDLATAAGKAEAAKDLAAMANAQGGMILIPARTSVESGREVITDGRDMPVERIDITRIRDVLKSVGLSAAARSRHRGCPY